MIFTDTEALEILNRSWPNLNIEDFEGESVARVFVWAITGQLFEQVSNGVEIPKEIYDIL